MGVCDYVWKERSGGGGGGGRGWGGGGGGKRYRRSTLTLKNLLRDTLQKAVKQ